MIKLTKRKGFNFFRSYYDVFNELGDKGKLQFIKALLDKQFLGIEPENLTGTAKFAWISQMHSIDEQVKGYQDKTGDILTPLVSPLVRGKITPSVQVEVQVKEEVQVKGGVVLPFDSNEFISSWDIWKDYKKKEFNFNYKTPQSEQAAIKKLNKLASGIEANAIDIINESMANGWKGLFKQNNNGITETITEQAGIAKSIFPDI